MTDLVLATTEADADAAAAIEQHHAELSGALAALTTGLLDAVAAGDAGAARTARDRLLRWCREELLPHAEAEERSLYPVAHGLDSARLLIDGMLAEHSAITGLVHEIAASEDAVRAAAGARALQAVFDGHLGKENELVLPVLSSAPGVSLADLLGGMHELLGGAAGEEEPAGCGGHSCSCGETDGPGYPELDARTVPHAIRHATIFGALSSVVPGGGLLLVAPHDPLPLLAQIEQMWPGIFEVAYVERGPEAWRLSFTRSLD